MGEINRITGRDYRLFNYYGAADADRIIIAMGSACEAIEETIDYLTAKGEKVGLVKVHLFRPFVAEKLLEVIPATAKEDRCSGQNKRTRRTGRTSVHGRLYSTV